MTAHAIGWRGLEPPRAATAVMAEGVAASGLAAATARRVRAGDQLHAAAADRILLVTGAPEQLPWAPDVVYLGREGAVLLPTVLTPDVPVDLLAQAVATERSTGTPGRRIVLLPGRVLSFELSSSSVDPDWLDRWAVGGAP